MGLIEGIVAGNCLEVMRQLPDNSVDAVVTDPPYGLSKEPDIVEVLTHWLAGDAYTHGHGGFGGRSWDSFVPGPEYWREVARVMKPGAHAAVFSSTRTEDLLGIALRLAGLERRDLLAWCFASGFPKSLDISKQFDFSRKDELEQNRVITKWIAEARDSAGLTNADINEHFGFVGMAQHWTTQKEQPTIPTPEQWPALLELLQVEPDEVPEDIRELWETLTELKFTIANERPDRETYVIDDQIVYKSAKGVVNPGTPITDLAKQYEDHGTGLKPAFEPCLLSRKPLEKRVIRTVEKWGTGALNIGAARIRKGDRAWPLAADEEREIKTHSRSAEAGEAGEVYAGKHSAQDTHQTEGQKRGYWPPNLRYCPKAARHEREAGLNERTMLCNCTCPDFGPVTQSGVRVCGICGKWNEQPTGAKAVRRKEGSAGMRSPRAGAGRTAGAIFGIHPTMKPMDQIRWLLRLLVPLRGPDGRPGLVLDPFGGSGTLAAAAECEGFRYLCIEKEPEYCTIARARAEHWRRRRTETAPWAAVPRR